MQGPLSIRGKEDEMMIRGLPNISNNCHHWHLFSDYFMPRLLQVLYMN